MYLIPVGTLSLETLGQMSLRIKQVSNREALYMHYMELRGLDFPRCVEVVAVIYGTNHFPELHVLIASPTYDRFNSDTGCRFLAFKEEMSWRADENNTGEWKYVNLVVIELCSGQAVNVVEGFGPAKLFRQFLDAKAEYLRFGGQEVIDPPSPWPIDQGMRSDLAARLTACS